MKMDTTTLIIKFENAIISTIHNKNIPDVIVTRDLKVIGALLKK